MPEDAVFKKDSFDVKNSSSTSVLSLFETVVADSAVLSTTDTTIIESSNSDFELANDIFYIEGLYIEQTIPAKQEPDTYSITLTIDLV